MVLLGIPGVGDLQAQGTPASITIVAAASFSGAELAPDSVAAAFGQGVASAIEVAQTTPLPLTLGGVTVTVRDSSGAERAAGLFFVSPGQVNFLVPSGAQGGPATVTLTGSNGRRYSGNVVIANTAPALFSANANG